MTDIWIDITADGSQSQEAAWGSDVTMNIEPAWETNTETWDNTAATADTQDTTPSEWADNWSSETTETKTLDIEALKNFTKEQAEKKSEETTADTKENKEEEDSHDDSQKSVYSWDTKARIKEIYNWVTSDYGSAPDTSGTTKKEDDQYINKSWLAITPEKFKEMSMQNLTLATYIWEIQPLLEEHSQMKQIIDTYEQRSKFDKNMSPEVMEYLEIFEKSQSWDEEAGYAYIERMWVELDRILPWLWGKFYQWLNSVSESPSKKASNIKKVEKMTKKDALDHVAKTLFKWV